MKEEIKLSIIIPAYNAEKTVDECLKSIDEQDFPKKNYEVLFMEGYSKDKTYEIAKKYPFKIIRNDLRNEEERKILALKHAKGEIVCFIDTDNILVGKDWISKMLKPFEDKDISFADTLYYGYRKNDPIRVKYQALIGGDDPLATYMGLYSRWCFFKNNWTDFPYDSEKKEGYLKVRLKNKKLVPALGSNGFLVRKNILNKFIGENFIHSDIVYDLVNSNYNCFAKVDTAIIHNQPTFFKNKLRRMERRVNKEIKIRYNYGLSKKKSILVAIYVALLFPIIIDSIRGFIKKPSTAWFFHPFACLIELAMHTYFFIFKRGYIGE